MKRVARGLIALCVALSLLLLALWVTSHAAPVSAGFTVRGDRWRVELSAGRLTVDDSPQRRLEQDAARSLAERRAGDARVHYMDAHSALLAHEARARPGDGTSTPEQTRERRRVRREAVMRQHELSIAEGALAAPMQPRPTRGGALPLLAAVVVVGAPPLCRLAAARLGPERRRRMRAARGLCRSCAYDLRATPGRCPECGAAAEGQGDGARMNTDVNQV